MLFLNILYIIWRNTYGIEQFKCNSVLQMHCNMVSLINKSKMVDKCWLQKHFIIITILYHFLINKYIFINIYIYNKQIYVFI